MVEQKSDEQLDTTDMPDLEREESAGQRRNQGLKILTPNQMLSTLPISLAQKKQEITLKTLTMKVHNYCILCTDKKTYKTTL